MVALALGLVAIMGAAVFADSASAASDNVSPELQGKVAGVTVTSDVPGSGSSIRIRGASSITGGVAPLYIVDGVIMDNIEYLNPADIESIEVLKDASATAIYGAIAPGGVVIITTKAASVSDAAPQADVPSIALVGALLALVAISGLVLYKK